MGNIKKPSGWLRMWLNLIAFPSAGSVGLSASGTALFMNRGQSPFWAS